VSSTSGRLVTHFSVPGWCTPASSSQEKETLLQSCFLWWIPTIWHHVSHCLLALSFLSINNAFCLIFSDLYFLRTVESLLGVKRSALVWMTDLIVQIMMDFKVTEKCPSVVALIYELLERYELRAVIYSSLCRSELRQCLWKLHRAWILHPKQGSVLKPVRSL
jgi:hypothetical protein